MVCDPYPPPLGPYRHSGTVDRMRSPSVIPLEHSVLKRDSVEAAVSRAVRLRESPCRELQLYLDPRYICVS